jgi:putative ABC transport system permease protein
VISDFRHFQGDSERFVFPSAYVPYSFDPTFNTGLTIRVAGEPGAITTAVREQIRSADPGLPVFAIQTVERLRQLSFWQFRLFGWMFSVFGAIALLLASVGVYGVLSYSVSQRVQEIGVRMALGAERKDVLRLILGHGMKLAAIGIVLGIAGAAAATLGDQDGVVQRHPDGSDQLRGRGGFLTLVALLASYVPARRWLWIRSSLCGMNSPSTRCARSGQAVRYNDATSPCSSTFHSASLRSNPRE